MRTSWPHFSTGTVGVACLVVVGVCLATDRWPGIVVPILVIALFAAIWPDTKGPFLLRLDRHGVEFRATTDDKRREELDGEQLPDPQQQL